MCMFCRSLFVLFLLTIVLSVRRFIDTDYPFGIFQLFLTRPFFLKDTVVKCNKILFSDTHNVILRWEIYYVRQLNIYTTYIQPQQMCHNPQNRNIITTFEIYLPSQIISLTAYCYIHVRRNRRGNQECVIHMHWQHWARKTQDEDKIKEKKTKKLKNKKNKNKNKNKTKTKTTEKITNTDPTTNPWWLQVLVKGSFRLRHHWNTRVAVDFYIKPVIYVCIMSVVT